MKKSAVREGGFTLVELMVTLVVLAIVAVSFLGLFTSLVRSTIIAKRQAVANTLATGQMEYIKSLPYDNLAVAGGSIYSTNPIPATTTKKLNNVTYTITTSINYIDDAYDGCATYANQQQTQQYCRNYPPPAGAPNPDQNPRDYKIVNVKVKDSSNLILAQMDTHISARVAETASTTGALFVTVIDSDGNKVSGATVNVVNTTITPNANLADSTDTNGIAIFYGLPPDTNAFDYHITASKSGYSTLTTLPPSGTLQPTYPSQKIFTQQSSFATLKIKKQASPSLLIEAVNTSGTPISNLKVYIKGGYKKYTDTNDTKYYYDNMSPTDNRPLTDIDGLVALQDLVPGPYIFCGDGGSSNCAVGGSPYYVAAAVPYSGGNPFNPVEVPVDAAGLPTFTYKNVDYIQKVRLILTSSLSFPRVFSMTPSNVSQSGGTLGNLPFTISGANLPCSTSAASCTTHISFVENGNTHAASCTGDATGNQLSCTVDLTGAGLGPAQMIVTVGGNTLTMPASPLLGGVIVTQ